MLTITENITTEQAVKEARTIADRYVNISLSGALHQCQNAIDEMRHLDSERSDNLQRSILSLMRYYDRHYAEVDFNIADTALAKDLIKEQAELINIVRKRERLIMKCAMAFSFVIGASLCYADLPAPGVYFIMNGATLFSLIISRPRAFHGDVGDIIEELKKRPVPSNRGLLYSAIDSVAEGGEEENTSPRQRF